jgi:hypothetical protein
LCEPMRAGGVGTAYGVGGEWTDLLEENWTYEL